jgi:orotidine-5'-phosphate decarboxylase
VYVEHLQRAREITGKDVLFLEPGIGTQGGFTEETIRASWTGPGSILPSASSAITQASLESDFAYRAKQAAQEIHDLCAQVIKQMGTEGH